MGKDYCLRSILNNNWKIKSLFPFNWSDEYVTRMTILTSNLKRYESAVFEHQAPLMAKKRPSFQINFPSTATRYGG